MTWSRKHTFIAGIALIALTNAIALGGVAWNRSGEPDSVLKLTQRELSRPYEFGFDREKGGLGLSLDWRVPSADQRTAYFGGRYGNPDWLNREKLASLGFDLWQRSHARAEERGYDRLLPREALVVLELDGPAYRRSLERARDWVAKEASGEAAGRDRTETWHPGESGAEILKREETSNSRLFAVDAGLDAAGLRAKYPDSTRYAIVRGNIRVQYNALRTGDAQWTGTIEGLHNDTFSVPLEFRQVIGSARIAHAWQPMAQGATPLEVTVAFGRRFEPWMVAARATQ